METDTAQAPPGHGTLGSFLKSRRARLTPADAGIASYGARRVPGLRREELAQLAGVSPTYYTRLEQGQSMNASHGVLEAIAAALGLTDVERMHLHDLARPGARKRPRPVTAPARARPGVVALLRAMPDLPAVVLDARTDVLAWNRLGHLLLAGHYGPDAPELPDERPNLTRMLFLDPHTRDLHQCWTEEATRAVASLRLIAGRHPDDADLADLVGELAVNSDEFSRLWSQHPVATCASGVKKFRHPEVGDLELRFEALHLPETDGHRLITYTAAPGSTAEAGLRLLAAAHARML